MNIIETEKNGKLIAAFVLVVLAVGGYLRFVMAEETEVNSPIRADAAEYYFYSVNMKECGVYSRSPTDLTNGCEKPPIPDNLRPPGYPIFLAYFTEYPPTRDMLRNILVAQAILGIVTIFSAFLLFRKMVSDYFALFGAVLITLSPHLVTAGIYILTETLFTLVLTLFALSAIKIREGNALVWALVSGIALAATALIRPTTL